MSFDHSKIPATIWEEVQRGLDDSDGALADELCDTRTVSSRKGTIQTMTAEQYLGRGAGSGRRSDGVLPGDELPERDSEFDDEVAYACRRFGAQDSISKTAVADIVNNFNVEPLQDKMEGCQADAEADIDAKLHDALTDTNLNVTLDVTSSGSAWSSDQSTPLNDVRTALGMVPGATTLYLGRNVVTSLLDHPDLLAESSNFSAGQLGDTQLANIFRRKFSPITDVIVGDAYYKNGAEEGQTFSLEHKSEDVAWLGYRRDIILTEFEDAPSPFMGQEDGGTKKSTTVWYEREIDIVRPNKETGLLFQNV